MTPSSSYFKRIREEVKWPIVFKTIGIKARNLRNENYITICNFHKERSPSLHFYSKSGRFRCYGCGRQGDIFSFVALYYFSNDKIKTYRWFKKNYGIPLPWEKL